MAPPQTPEGKPTRSSRKRAPKSAPAKTGSEENNDNSSRPTMGGKMPIPAGGRRPVGGKGPMISVPNPKVSPDKVQKNVKHNTNAARDALIKAKQAAKKKGEKAAKKNNADEQYGDGEDLGEAEAREYQEYLIDEEVRDQGVEVKPEWHEDEEGGAGIIVPVSRNGRVVGRKLIMWHRARMYEKILLMIIFETYRDGYQIPWDRVVQRLSPGSTGASAVQHFNRLRYILLSEGHLVPPPLGKLGSAVPPYIRGYVRDMESENIYATRVVQWAENVEDRKESLEIPGLIRGSGNYRKSEKAKPNLVAQVKEAVVAKKPELVTPEDKVQSEVKTPKRVRAPRARAIKAQPKIKDEADPAELDSEDDYTPGAAKRCRRSTRKRTVVKHEPISDDEIVTNEPFTDADTDVEDDVFCATPQMNTSTSMPMSRPRGSLRIKLNLAGEKLAKFPAGESGNRSFKSMLATSLSSRRNRTVNLGDDSDGDEDVPDSPSMKVSSRLHSSYAGPSVHGNIDEVVEKFKRGGSSHGSARMSNNGLFPTLKSKQDGGNFINPNDLVVQRAEVQYPYYDEDFEGASRDDRAYNAGMNVITNDQNPWNRERHVPGPVRYGHISNLPVFRLNGQEADVDDEMPAGDNVLADITNDAIFPGNTTPEYTHEGSFDGQEVYPHGFQPEYGMGNLTYATPRAQWEAMNSPFESYGDGFNNGNVLFGANSFASSGYPIHEDRDNHPLSRANLEVRFATAEELNSIFNDNDENAEPTQYMHPVLREETPPLHQSSPLDDDELVENRLAHANDLYEAATQLQAEAEAEFGYTGDESQYYAQSWGLE